jgi:hypothetical protein
MQEEEENAVKLYVGMMGDPDIGYSEITQWLTTWFKLGFGGR